MPRFADIFDAQTLDHRSEAVELNESGRAVGWTVLHPGESICLEDEIQSVVISGVTWGKPDLDVLDEPATRDTAGTRVWFFNIDKVFPGERILPWPELPRRAPVFWQKTMANGFFRSHAGCSGYRSNQEPVPDSFNRIEIAESWPNPQILNPKSPRSS